MAVITIKKAKIEDRTLEVELLETVTVEGAGTATNEIIKKCKTLVHDDLIARFDKLKIHLVKICDFKKADMITQDNAEEFNLNDLAEYQIKGFSIGGDDESEGVVLIGSRTFDSGKVLNIVTPFTKFSDDVDEYELASELAQDIEAAKYEVEQYLFAEKWAVKQMELPFDEEEQSQEAA